MTPERVIELAGHRQVPPWVMKLVMDAISDEQEPVAWWHPKMGAYDNNYFDAMQPLYLSPVRTKDLTDDEIKEIWSFGNGAIYFARAVIAADREKNRGTA